MSKGLNGRSVSWSHALNPFLVAIIPVMVRNLMLVCHGSWPRCLLWLFLLGCFTFPRALSDRLNFAGILSRDGQPFHRFDAMEWLEHLGRVELLLNLLVVLYLVWALGKDIVTALLNSIFIYLCLFLLDLHNNFHLFGRRLLWQWEPTEKSCNIRKGLRHFQHTWLLLFFIFLL